MAYVYTLDFALLVYLFMRLQYLPIEKGVAGIILNNLLESLYLNLATSAISN